MDHHILIIDDNSSVQADFRKILGDKPESNLRWEAMTAALQGLDHQPLLTSGYRIDTASQGREGLTLLENALAEGDPYLLAFVDMRMPPGWDGVETTQRLWQAQPDLQVVICTAFSDYTWDDIRQKLGDSENLLILRKPFDNIEVLQMAKAMTRKWIATKEAATSLKDLDRLVKERTHELEEENRIRSKAELKLRESEQRLRLALQAAKQGLYDLNIQTGETKVTSEYATMLGYDPDWFQESNSRWLERMHPEDQDRVAAAYRDYICGKRHKYELEYRQRTESGDWKWILSLGQIVAWDADGRPLRMLGTHTDITDRKKAEEESRMQDQKIQQAQRLESLGVLAGGIAHDFNNLLAVIMGNASFVLKDISQVSSARECLQEIMNASNRAADLCRQMLAYAGKARMVVQHIDLSGLTNDMVGLLKSSISKNAILNLDLKPKLPAINGDATQLRQIVMNLVINASEALGDGHGMIHISTGCMECSAAYLRGACLEGNPAEGSYTWLEVRDTGPGMDAEAQRHIFEPFFTTKFAGRGLGLSAVRGILQSHHGFMTLRSQPGQGSTFRVFFPAENQIADHSPAVAQEPDKWKGSGTILLVDDEECVRATGRKLLEWMGFQVLTAGDGLEALQVYRDHGKCITLVLLDLTMPRLGGEETLRELRHLNPQVRVVLSSGYAETDIGPRFADKGLTGILEKPFSIAQMQSQLRKALSSKPVIKGFC